MKIRSILPVALAMMSAGLLTGMCEAASYAIGSNGKTELVGSSASVPGGGANTNFAPGTVVIGTTSARFQLMAADTNTRFADMKVTVAAVTGSLGSPGGTSGLMIVQTVNSQGLQDSGTMSVLANFGAKGAGGRADLTLLFEFFQPDTETGLPVALEVTSFDYDYNQFIEVAHTDFMAGAHGTKLTRTSTATTTLIADTTNSDATFNQSSNAVVLNNVPDSSFEVTVGKVGTGNALFMFEFRDPSQVLDFPLDPLPIPEPSAFGLVACGILMSALTRRR